MRKIIVTIATICCQFTLTLAQNGAEVLRKVEANLSSENRILTVEMTIKNKRASRTLEAKVWAVGSAKSFTEYLSPQTERGTKMLKINDQLWMYSPQADRVIQISGHMLRQSVMGSDLSYEDMMEDRRLTQIYEAHIIGRENLNEQQTIVIELIAKVPDVAYHQQKMWVDAQRYVPLKQEMYARSGTLLRVAQTLEVRQVEQRWFPTQLLYRDMLRNTEGTVFKIKEVKFDQPIPESIFSRAALR